MTRKDPHEMERARQAQAEKIRRAMRGNQKARWRDQRADFDKLNKTTDEAQRATLIKRLYSRMGRKGWF